MWGGVTYASRQTGRVEGVIYTAGSSDLKIDSDKDPDHQVWLDNVPTGGAFNQTKLKPGSTGSQIIDIKNFGDFDGTTSVRLDVTANAENGALSPEVEAGDSSTENGNFQGELAQNTQIKISYSPQNNNDFSLVAWEGTLSQWIGYTDYITLGAIGHGLEGDNNGIASVKVDWSILDTPTSNQIMTDSFGVNIIFGLEE